MADTRYTLIRDLARNELQLSTDNVSDILALSLFQEALKVYSRFRGIRKVTVIEFEAEVADYVLPDNLAHIIEIYWNDTYPGTVLAGSVSDAVSAERLHNPSLETIAALKARLREKYQDVPFQEWHDYYDETDHMVRLDPTPTTDVVVEYRELFDSDSFPENDSEAIKALFKAKMLEYIIGTAQLRSVGDAQFNIDGMQRMKKGFEADFYNTVRTARIVHQ